MHICRWMVGGVLGAALLLCGTAARAQELGPSGGVRSVVRVTDNNPEVPARTVPAGARTAHAAPHSVPTLTQGWWLAQPSEDNTNSAARAPSHGGSARETPPPAHGALDSLVRIRERRLERAEKLRDLVRKGSGRTDEAAERREPNGGLARLPNGAPLTPPDAPSVEFAGARPAMRATPANATAPVTNTSASGPEIVIDLPDDLTVPPKPNHSRGLFGGSRN